jgi:hypothetical protein
MLEPSSVLPSPTASPWAKAKIQQQNQAIGQVSPTAWLLLLLLVFVSSARNESWQINRLFQALHDISGAGNCFPLPREDRIRVEIKVDPNHPY